jgi:IMP dehydrogenase
MQFKKALSFDDVLLRPQYSDKGSRSSVDLSTTISTLKLRVPIISANMPSVTGLDMCVIMSDFGGLGIVDRMIDLERQIKTIQDFKKARPQGLVGGSIGVSENWKDCASQLIDSGASLICVDVAHGDQARVYDVMLSFLEDFANFPLMVGNFADQPLPFPKKHISKNLSFKIGVGGGSVCTTRIQTGCGVPTLQSIIDTTTISTHDKINAIIADGGIKNSGDIVKSLAAGADAVMIGSLLAGTKEAPGDILKDDKTGNKYKIYRGNASFGSKNASSMKAEFIEGAETLVKYKGSADKILQQLEDGIRSGMTYCGSSTIKELQTKANFVEITPAGMSESKPHGLF